VSAVEPDLSRDSAVDDHERRAQVGRRLYAVQIERLFAHRLYGKQAQWKILRPAARHDGVRSQSQWRCFSVARRDPCDRLVPRAITLCEHALNALRCRPYDRKAIAPAALEAQRVDGIEILVHLNRRTGRLE
jgi:hypothetical protein